MQLGKCILSIQVLFNLIDILMKHNHCSNPGDKRAERWHKQQGSGEGESPGKHAHVFVMEMLWQSDELQKCLIKII